MNDNSGRGRGLRRPGFRRAAALAAMGWFKALTPSAGPGFW